MTKVLFIGDAGSGRLGKELATVAFNYSPSIVVDASNTQVDFIKKQLNDSEKKLNLIKKNLILTEPNNRRTRRKNKRKK